MKRRSHKQQRARENSGEQEPSEDSEDILAGRRDRQAELLAMQERATNERVDRCFEAALGVAERDAKRAKETAESRSRAENDHGEQSEGRSNRNSAEAIPVQSSRFPASLVASLLRRSSVGRPRRQSRITGAVAVTGGGSGGSRSTGAVAVAATVALRGADQL